MRRRFGSINGVISGIVLGSLLPVNALAQGGGRSGNLEFGDHEGAVVEGRARETGSIGGRDRPDTRGGGGGGGGAATSRPVDAYPSLTRANNAYTQAVAAWQQAYRAYQSALANQATLKAKYTDGNGNVRPGWDYYSVQAVLRAADNEALYAWDSLNRATSERNAAQSRAAQEFKAASEQFARAERERQAREDQRRREYQRELQSDRRGDRGGR